MYRIVGVMLVALVSHGAAFSSGIGMGRAVHTLNLNMMAAPGKKEVLIVGGTRFSGLYLWEELHKRGHSVTLFNRGKTALKKLPGESDSQFEQRKRDTTFIQGDRKDIADMKAKLGRHIFDVVYDMGGRESADTEPLVDLFGREVEHFIYMSSAGVYKKSLSMPHMEVDAVDPKSRHKGKLETEAMLRARGVPFTSIRPTYIYGPGNYNPLEEWYFTRLDAGKTVCIPGHGDHLTGLGHVRDLAVAMAQIIGRPQCKGKIYNVQDAKSVSFSGLAKLCGEAMGMTPDDVKIKLYNKKDYDFGEKKAFPMREQHFFCGIEEAMQDLDWEPKFDMARGLKDSYENDFKSKKASGKLKIDFTTDDMILGSSGAAAPVAAASNKPYNAKDGVKEVATSKIKNANPDDFSTYMAKRKAAAAGVAWHPGYQ